MSYYKVLLEACHDELGDKQRLIEAKDRHIELANDRITALEAALREVIVDFENSNYSQYAMAAKLKSLLPEKP